MADRIDRILIVGASGYLGSAIASGLRDSFDLFGTYFHHPVRLPGVTCFQLDCTQGGAILDAIKMIKPDLVIYAAGLHQLSACMADPMLADSLNFKAAGLIFNNLPPTTPFIYLSTDEVHSDITFASSTISEKDTPKPLHILGSTKASGELSTIARGRNSMVLRFGTIFGEAMGGGALIRPNWIDAFLRKFEHNEPVTGFKDMVRSYTYVGDCVRAVKTVIDSFNSTSNTVDSTLYNVASKNSLSQYDFLLKLAEMTGHPAKLVRPSTTLLDRQLRGKVALNCTLNVDKFQKIYETEMPEIEDALTEYLFRFKIGTTGPWT